MLRTVNWFTFRNGYPISSASLSLVQRCIRRLNDLGSADAMHRKDGNPQGGGHLAENLPAVGHADAPNGRTQFLGLGYGVAERGFGQNQGEFLTAVAAGDVRVADMVFDDLGDRLENDIPASCPYWSLKALK